MEDSNMSEMNLIEIVGKIVNKINPSIICDEHNININTYNLLNHIYSISTNSNSQKMTEIKKDMAILRKKYRKLWLDKTIIQEALEGKL